jgi:hypothetical protein
MRSHDQKIRVVLALLFTLAILHFVPNRILVLVVLVGFWFVIFYPFNTGEVILSVVAAVVFLLQDYLSLKAGLFKFKDEDILLVPYYEPALWGFYFLSMKRFISGREKMAVAVDWKSVAGTVVTSVMFPLFSANSHALSIATACSTAFLFVLFHTRLDLYYALYALILGLIIELFGVSTGLWSYPAPDFLGIPYWFATMWISVGLLGRRFLVPATEWLAERMAGQRA